MVSRTIIVKVVLFIGLLLLCIGLFYYGYDKYFYKEGFQSTVPSTLNSCSVEQNPVTSYMGQQCCDNPYAKLENTCDARCIGVTTTSSKTNKDATLGQTIKEYLFSEETVDERLAYDIYEQYNLNDLAQLAYPPDLIPTSNAPYIKAQGLTPFDFSSGQAVPWDFDNSSFLPKDVLWGFVHPRVSQAIFTKCESQAIFGNINSLNYDAQGQPFYSSQYFNTILYNEQDALPYQYADFFIDFYAEMMFETMIHEGITEPMREGGDTPLGEGRKSLRESGWIENEKSRDFNRYVNDRIGPLKAKGLNPTISQLKSARAVAKAKVEADFVSGAYSTKYQKYTEINKLTEKYKNIGLWRATKQFGPRGIIKKALWINPAVGENITPNTDADYENQKAARKARIAAGQATGLERLNALRPGKVINTYKSMSGMYKTAGTQVSHITRAILDRVGVSAAFRVVGAMKTRMYTLIARAVISLFGLKASTTALAVATGPVGWAIDAFFTAFTLACVTVIPALFNAIIDAEAVCPYYPSPDLEGKGAQTYSITCDIMNSNAGGVGINILQSIPGFGDVLYAFGEFLCMKVFKTWPGQPGLVENKPITYYKTDDNAPLLQLKRNLFSPIYYNDSTLSIYSLVGNPNGNGFGFVGRFPVGDNDPDKRLYDHRRFHLCPIPGRWVPPNPLACKPQATKTCGIGDMPLYQWVDYSNQIMLDKMAQFYFDTSRKFAAATYDGYLEFEYISKFYGLIATTEFSCDVLCEITLVKFDPVTGRQICSAIVPSTDPSLRSNSYVEHVNNSSLGRNQYRPYGQYMHDRRFYFIIDQKRGMTKEERERDCGGSIGSSRPVNDNDKLDACMNDNYVKFIVTACTHVDGTAPDALLQTADGEATETPIIGLGTPEFAKDDLSKLKDRVTTYYPPMPTPYPATRRNGSYPFAVPNQVSDDKTCKNLVRTYTKYGTTMNRPIEQPEGATANISNAVDIVQDTKYPSKWIYDNSLYKNYGLSRDATIGLVTIEDEETGREKRGYPTKFKSVTTVGCPPWDNDCILAQPNSLVAITLQSVMGYMPYAFGLTGGLITTTAQVTGFAEMMQCILSEATKVDGKFVLNGFNVASKPTPTGYLHNQGPVPDYAPGYIPEIKKCKNQKIELYDCVNRHAVRRFIKIYEKENPTRSVSKITNITPRRTTTCEKFYCNPGNYSDGYGDKLSPPFGLNQPFVAEDYDLLFPKNDKHMCVYDISYNIIDEITFAIKTPVELSAKVGLELQRDSNICTFLPITHDSGTSFFSNDENVARRGTIPNIEPFKRNMKPMYGDINPLNTTITYLSLPPGCPGPLLLNCDDYGLKNHLVRSFNIAHSGYPEMISTSVTNARTWLTVNGSVSTQYCTYSAHFSSVFYPIPDLDGKYRSTNIARDVTFILEPTTNANKCLYDLDTDDFPVYTFYAPMPHADRWFDAPAKVPSENTNFLPLCTYSTNCIGQPVGVCTQYPKNCANPDLMTSLINQYNHSNKDIKIIQVNRAYTPVNPGGSPVCDYDVQIMRNTTTFAEMSSNVVQNETLRLNLLNDNYNKCLYRLNKDEIVNKLMYNNLNTGYSLNLSDTLGMLDTPYQWATSFTNEITDNVAKYVKMWLGLGVKDVVDGAVDRSYDEMSDIRKLINTAISLEGCSSMTCNNNNALISSMINRYNFDNYPIYDLSKYPASNAVQKRTIVQVLRSGNATSKKCHLQLYEKIETFPNFMYTAGSPNTQYWMRYYQFELSSITECKFKVTPFTPSMMLSNSMDVSGMQYGIQDESTKLDTSWNIGGSYSEVMIPCNDVEVFKAVVKAYNALKIRLRGMPETDPDGIPYPQQHNTVHVPNGDTASYIWAFNAMPNVCEYQTATYHAFYDPDFGMLGRTGPDKTFIVATWPTDSQNQTTMTQIERLASEQGVVGPQYEVDTGYYCKLNGVFVSSDTDGAEVCTPVIQEFFFPNLQFTENGYIDENENPIVLPYLVADNPDVIPIQETYTNKWKAKAGNMSKYIQNT